MPKQIHFLVGVEEEAAGRVMRLLHTMPGVATVQPEFEKRSKHNGAVEPRGPYKTRKSAVQLDETGEEAVAKALFGEALTARQLKDVFVSQGRSASSINSVLHTMKNNREIQLGDEGSYSLTKLMRDRLRHRKASKKRGK